MSNPRIRYALLLLCVAAACFWNTPDLGFDTHDREYITDSAQSITDPAFFFSLDKRMPGRPVFEAMLLLEYVFFGNNPAPYHIFGVLLHAFASYMLFIVCLSLGCSERVSMVAGFLFLINVSHFEAVHWISAQCYPLAFILMSLGTIGYLRFLSEDSHCNWMRFALPCMAAALVHPAAAIVPLFCAIGLWTHRGKNVQSSVLACIFFILVVLQVFILKSTMPNAAQNTVLSGDGVLDNFVWMLTRLLSTDHQILFQLQGIQPWDYFTSAVVALLVLLLAYMEASESRKFVHLFAFWTVLCLVPFALVSGEYMQSLPAGPSRYLYFSSAGVSVLLAFGVERSSNWFRESARIRYGLLGFILIVSYLSLQDVQAVSYFTSGRSYIASGDPLSGTKQYEKAIAHAHRSLELGDIYARLAALHIGTEKGQSYIDEGLLHFPDNGNLRLSAMVSNSLNPHVDNPTRRWLLHNRGDAIRDRVIARLFFNAAVNLKPANPDKALSAIKQAALFDEELVRENIDAQK